MLSNPSSGVADRRTYHRRQNSTPAMYAPALVRPLPAAVQRQLGHRRGLSLEGRPMRLGQQCDHNTNQTVSQESHPSVSIDTNYRQQYTQQPSTQVAQQHSHQPGTQVLESTQTSLVSSPQCNGDISPHDAETLERRKQRQQQLILEKYNELQNAMNEMNEFGGVDDLQANLGALMTPEATPQKQRFGRGGHVDFAPMPSNLGDMKDIHLDPPMFDDRFAGLTSPLTDMSYASSYCSDHSSPSHTHASPHSSPHHQISHDFGQFAPLNSNVIRQIFPNSQVILQPPHGAHPDNSFYSSNATQASSPQAIEIAGVQIDATIEDTGISNEDVQQFISAQDTESGRWFCLWNGCNKDFGRRENIRAHVQTHLNDRQYKCNHCNKKFVRQHDLKRHAKIHTGDKSNKCPCGAGFARQDALTRHRQRGMCSGAFPNVEKRNAKRGRPKKNRPDMEARVSKAAKTRRALASSASSVSASSPPSGSMSPDADFNLDTSHYNDSYESFDSQSDHSSDPFSDSLENLHATSPISQESKSFSSGGVAPEATMMSRTTTQASTNSFDRTPPMSPSDSTSPASVPSPGHPSIEHLPSFSKIETPPGSPCMQNDNIESLFDESYEFNSYCGTTMDSGSIDALINCDFSNEMNFDAFRELDQTM
ncbi:hypothetical protein EJ05DRAFT_536274 [Pseudovirgaria hyperparasitica]|uniref:C2H2-type domain-containing protein n=1 Tax=Pseudovirgaria hyperparasitica TaxID=470096 RepID=A0A6A6WBM8_9PEZI|nr:uncharacterized protein EJ05DRAFT_536274 [Pseudovirgaria hyperparasitica]KAF2760093.1 hypothetical protein EJ05DRAFT_536274 [Pseudovirgaria hyperparasitica]